MDIGGAHRLSRTLFYVGAMLAFIGLGLYILKYNTPGVICLVIGVAILVLAFTVMKFIIRLRMNNRK